MLAPGLAAPLFNRAMGVGLTGPAGDEAVDRVVAAFRGAGCPVFAIEVVEVGPSEVAEWASLLVGAYRLPPGFATWLAALRKRPGWRHYLAREGGIPVAARSAFVRPGSLAWLGIDGPVPGVMTGDVEPDRRIVARIVADGLAAGATGFVADVEAYRADGAGPSCAEGTHGTLQGLPNFAGISLESAGSRRLCLHLITIAPGGRARAHMHRGHETALYVTSGAAGMRFGPALERYLEVRAGDFLYIPPDMPHQPFNLSETEPACAIAARTDPNEQESVVLLPHLEAGPAGHSHASLIRS